MRGKCAENFIQKIHLKKTDFICIKSQKGVYLQHKLKSTKL